MADPVQIDNGMTEFVINGQSYRLDLLEVNLEMRRISKACQGQDDEAWITPFIEWLQKQGLPPLRPMQAYAIWSHTELALAKTKKNFVNELRSLASTESTPFA